MPNEGGVFGHIWFTNTERYILGNICFSALDFSRTGTGKVKVAKYLTLHFRKYLSRENNYTVFDFRTLTVSTLQYSTALLINLHITQIPSNMPPIVPTTEAQF